MPRASGTDASCRTFEPLPGKTFHICQLALRVAFIILATGSSSLAQGGLYGPEAPRDTSYLRVINARPGEPVTPLIGGGEWDPLAYAQVSPYRQLPPGEHAADLDGQELTLTTHPESFTTLVLLEDGLVAIEDTPLRDISRGLLTLYNLTSDSNLSLRTADGTDVITGVGPRSAAGMAISEAEVALAVFSEEGQIGALEPQLYRRGEAHSVIVLPEGSDPRVVYARAGAER